MEYDVHQIPLDKIDRNPLNPQGRGEAADIKSLLHSITESGLYYPILVNRTSDTPERYLIIEGHRRYAVFEMKAERNPDFAKIPALVIQVGREYITKIFREINETSKKLSGKQWLEVSALGGRPEDLPSRLAPSIKALTELFSADELTRIARRQGPSVHGLGRRVATFCGWDPNNTTLMRKVVAWLINSGDSVNVRIAMEQGAVPKVKAAIEAKTRLDGSPYPDGEFVSATAAAVKLAA